MAHPVRASRIHPDDTVFTPPPPPPPPLLSPSLLPIRVDARKVKTSRNNGRLTSFFNGSCIDSRCTWFRVITRRLAYCAIVGVDLLKPAYGGVVSIRWCVPRFTLRRRSPFSYPPSILRSYPFPKMFRSSLRPCYRFVIRLFVTSNKRIRIDYFPCEIRPRTKKTQRNRMETESLTINNAITWLISYPRRILGLCISSR